MTTEIKIGIIGGTGLSNPDVLENQKEKSVTTPYGAPSDVLLCGTIDGVNCVVLSRHGRGHSVNPTSVNYRANICALKQEGCTHILVTTACGSLKEEVVPGNFVIINQFIDRTFNRQVTFYDQQPGSWKGVSHIPMSEPFNPRLRKVLCRACELNGAVFHPEGLTVTIEGPRFSSFAESNLYRSWGADLVNMTTIPEVTLANEAGIMYAALAMATDYDCWRKDGKNVNVENVMDTFKKNSSMAVKVIRTAVQLIAKDGDWDNEIKSAKEKAFKSIM